MNARYVGETYSKRTKPGVAEAATSIYATREAPSACLDLSYDACQLLGSDGPVDDVAVQHGAPPLRQHAGEKVFAAGHDITDAACGGNAAKANVAHVQDQAWTCTTYGGTAEAGRPRRAEVLDGAAEWTR